MLMRIVERYPHRADGPGKNCVIREVQVFDCEIYVNINKAITVFRIKLYNLYNSSHRSDQYHTAGEQETSNRTLNEMKVKCFISYRFFAA